jgi:hypothetical protein
MRPAEAAIVLQLDHLRLLHRLAVAEVLAVMAVRLRLVVLVVAEALAVRLVLVTLLQLRLAKEIMVVPHQVLPALAAGVLVLLEITLLRPELQ